MKQHIILCHGRGDYIARLQFDNNGQPEISGTSKREEATAYTAQEAESLLENLGPGFSVEPFDDLLDLPFRRHRSSKKPVNFLLTKLCGGGRKTIADGPTTLGEAIGILESGMHDIDHDRLEAIRLERTGEPYDENGNIAELFEETVSDLLEVHNLGDWSASLEDAK